MNKSLSALITNWVNQSRGWFSIWQIDDALNITTSKDKNIRRVILHSLWKQGGLWRVRKGTQSIYSRTIKPL